MGNFDPAPFLSALDGDHATFIQFGRQFLAMFPGALQSLRDAAGQGDAEMLRERAHCLKGSLALFRAHRVLTEIEAIEYTCRAAPDRIEASMVDALEAASRDFGAELDYYCSAGGRESAGMPRMAYCGARS